MSLWIPYNPNPLGLQTSDCTIRALCKSLNTDWDTAFNILSDAAREMCVLPSSKIAIWGVLRQHGFYRRFVRDDCEFCITVEDFAREHPRGTYVLNCDDHVVAIQGGKIYDSWDSSKQIPIYYWFRKEEY